MGTADKLTELPLLAIVEGFASGFEGSNVLSFSLARIGSRSFEDNSEASELDSERSELNSEGSELNSEASELNSKRSELYSEGSELDSEASELDPERSEEISEASPCKSVSSEMHSAGCHRSRYSETGILTATGRKTQVSAYRDLWHPFLFSRYLRVSVVNPFFARPR